MKLPEVIIQNNYSDYLKGMEVDAVMSEYHFVEKGVRVMGVHDSIAVNTDIAVPKESNHSTAASREW